MANQQLKAKLVLCSVPTRNSDAARAFYNTLFGGDDFARSLNASPDSYYRPIHRDGLTLTINSRQNDREPLTCFFAVDDLQATMDALQKAGGTVVVQPDPVTVTAPPEAQKALRETVASQSANTDGPAGRWAGVLDPDGNYFAIIELAPNMQSLFNAEPNNRMLSQEQVQSVEHWKQHGQGAMKSR